MLIDVTSGMREGDARSSLMSLETGCYPYANTRTLLFPCLRY